MKITIPFFVFDSICTLNRVLELIHRDVAVDRLTSVLPRGFTPRRIETRRGEGTSRIRLWADGVYVTLFTQDYSSGYGDHSDVVKIHVKARKYGWKKAWVEFTLNPSDILQAEKNARESIPETDEQQISARAEQQKLLGEIRALLTA